MIKSIKVKPNSFEEDILLFKTAKFKKLNILFGGNGVGKTTLLNGIINNRLELETKKELIIKSYINSKDNFRHINQVTYKDMGRALLQKVNANELSEGQSIIYSLLAYIENTKKIASNNPDKTVVLVLDEIDSGLSAENINMILHLICDLLKMGNIQLFISSNHYHFVYVFKNVFNMYTGKWIEINSYDEYFNKLVEEMTSLGKIRDYKFLEPTTLDF